MGVTLTLRGTITAVEEIAAGTPGSMGSSTRKVTHSGFSKSHDLSGTTTVPVTKCAYFDVPLVGGAATVDLAALVGTNAGAVNGTGLKAQAVFLENKEDNPNEMTFTPGDANGYALAGPAWSETLQPKQWSLRYLADASPDVAADAKTIKITGTGTQVARIGIILG